ncbi:MAG TPA: PLP-dependent aminotransferase family protein [Blastocatellia bacterium]
MEQAKIDYRELLSETGKSLTPNAIRKLTPLVLRSDVISLAAGAPSPDVFPLEELSEITAHLIKERGRLSLQYGPTRGNKKLVEQVGELMHERGVEVNVPSDIVITSGSQQGLDLAARVVLDPGDVALVELPSYVGGTIALHNSRAELMGVRQDESGIIIEDLLEKLHRERAAGRKIKCFYTIPNFQNPSGVTLAEERRHELVRIAREYDFLIFEDDPYYELHFDEKAAQPPPLAQLAPERVIYMSSFSKILAPGFRAAWLCAPEPIASKIELMKEGADLSSSQLDMAIVSDAIARGLVERRLPDLRNFYSLRCRMMLDTLESRAPAGWHWTKPRGGFFVLLEGPRGFDATTFLPKALEAGVAFVPGQPFFVDSSGANTLRLAFSKETPENISDGIRRLCDAIRN